MLTMTSRRAVLSLYKNILRQHSFSLKPKQRELGDLYVRYDAECRHVRGSSSSEELLPDGTAGVR